MERSREEYEKKDDGTDSYDVIRLEGVYDLTKIFVQNRKLQKGKLRKDLRLGRMTDNDEW